MYKAAGRFYASFGYALASISIAITGFACSPKIPAGIDKHSKVNTAHLDALYQEVPMGGENVGIIHIYAEYPDYHWLGDQDEGIACVDDASRAAIFYFREYQKTHNKAYKLKACSLFHFLESMQADNGFFYNFIWPDGTINKEGATSKPEPVWWAWRSLWAFGEGAKVIKANSYFAKKLEYRRQILISAILKESFLFSTKTDTAGGFTIPVWLPKQGATDQAAIMLTGLSLAYEQDFYKKLPATRDSIARLMNHLADGMMMMQIESPGDFYDGAFLSWQNLWHAYANMQSYALLCAGDALKDPHMTAHALYEINTFYKVLYERNFLESFWVRDVHGKLNAYDLKSVPQIAYGITPMIMACMKAFDLTGEVKYKIQAQQLATWFSGQNPAHTPMYDPGTGRGFDGLSGVNNMNRNAGAESTIESLLAIQAIE